MRIKYFSIEEILVLHAYQISKFGGSYGVRDLKILESTLMRPQVTFSGKDLYKDVYEKASALCIGLIKNHPFIDGNKRVAVHSLLLFLELNGVSVNIKPKTLTKITFDIIKGSIGHIELVNILKENSDQIYL